MICNRSGDYRRRGEKKTEISESEIVSEIVAERGRREEGERYNYRERESEKSREREREGEREKERTLTQPTSTKPSPAQRALRDFSRALYIPGALQRPTSLRTDQTFHGPDKTAAERDQTCKSLSSSLPQKKLKKTENFSTAGLYFFF